jgi:Carboxypeptidase regulatory-like domain/TonB dependent receptor
MPWRISWLSIMLSLGAPFLAQAQTRDTAGLFGTVTDKQGAGVAGASIKLISINTGQVRTVTAGTGGEYQFNALPVGSYSIAVEQPSFRRYQQTGILLQANENAKVDVPLEVGSVETVVNVVGSASQVETRSATLKDTVDSARVVELPLNGRNAADLALLVPGVVTSGSNSGDDNSNIHPRGQKEISINGSRNNNVRYTMDGGENMDNLFNVNLPFPFPDALEEFSVETSNMGLEQGSSSAGAVNVVTKSGTNSVHGDAFWFVRNTALNASNFFSRQQDQLKRNQTGFTLGGPVLKNRLFAFGGFQQLWLRSASGASRSQTLSAAERSGNFSGNPITLINPLTQQPFAGNIIPASQLSPAALRLLSVSPLPGPNGFTNYTFSVPENGQQYIGRLDYVLNQKHTFLFRAFQNDQTNPFHSSPDNIHASRTGGYQDSISATVAHNYTVNAGTIVHTQLSGMHLKSRAESDFNKSIRDFGVKVYAPSNDIDVALTNSGVTFSAPPRVSFNRATQELLHDWTMVKGSHTFSWGLQLNWRQYNEDTIYQSSGAYRFDGHVTGFDRADFMLGRFSNFLQNNGELENRRQFNKGFYFGDIWRISSRLTASFGLRYEPYSFFSDTMDRNQTFDLGNYQAGVRSKIFLNAPPGLLYHGDADPSGGIIGKTVTKPDWNNWAPRVGLAWDPLGDGKTSVRAGYAIFYDAPSLFSANNANNVAPFSYSVQFNDGLFDNPYLGRESLNIYPLSGFSANAPFPSPLRTIVLDGQYVTAQTQNWNLTVEREILPNTRLRVAYVGTRATHLKGEYDQNAPVYNPNLTLAQNRATIDARRPLRGFQTIDRFFHGLDSNYHSLQLSVNKRYSNGFTILASYTWSKALDYQSINQAASDAALSNPYNFFFGRGPTNQNRTNRLVTSFLWDLPGQKLSSRAARALLGDWKVSGILTLQSGRPFSIAATGDPLAGISGARADLLGNTYPVLDPGRSKGEEVAAYFDKTRFRNAAPDTWGTLGRNILTGPGFSNLDASLVKGFHLPLGEKGLGQFRFEAFNVFNRTNFAPPNTGLTNPAFGQLTSTDGDPRILQLAVKVVF